MADKYEYKIGINLDSAQLDKVLGKISDEIVSAGKISDDFINNALETAKKYNDEINKQRKIISEIDAKLKDNKVDSNTRKLLETTRTNAQAELDKYTAGDGERLSNNEVQALAQYANQHVKKSLNPVANGLKKLGQGFVNLNSKISKFFAVVNGVITVFSNLKNTTNAYLESFANYAGQINPLGAFGSSSQRDLMARYGMTGTQALGFANTLQAMNMSESDLGKMTADQRKVFNELNSYWSDLMGTIDPDKLQKFTENMTKFQTIQAKFNMGIQGTIMKLLSESPKFEAFMGKIEDLMNETLQFLSSEAAQKVFNGLVDFLTTVVSILEKAMRLISKIPGFGGTTTNNTDNSTTNSTFNIYGSSYSNNSELARAISYSNKGGYSG